MHRTLRIVTFLTVGGATLIASSTAAADERPTNVWNLPDAKSVHGFGAQKASKPKPSDGSEAADAKPKDADAKKGGSKAKSPEPAAPEPPPVAETQSPPPAEPPKDAPATAEQRPKEEKEEHPISLGAVVGTAGHSMGLGIGLRGGYTFPQHVYVGGVFAYHFGTSVGGEKITFFYPGVEGGYDVKLGPALIRPFAGAGFVFANASGPVSGSSNSFTVWPGVALVGDIPKSPVFIGADVRLLVFTAGGDPALAAQLAAGVNL